MGKLVNSTIFYINTSSGPAAGKLYKIVRTIYKSGSRLFDFAEVTEAYEFRQGQRGMHSVYSRINNTVYRKPAEDMEKMETEGKLIYYNMDWDDFFVGKKEEPANEENFDKLAMINPKLHLLKDLL